ncbi:hypothetical protein [Pseudofrankia inefficax]|uniref:hypothetical protein n=1 Tax=Pseudofrankia inefficax (strain DSM 45817 / CECT 9037 / DDB 130130 / EuI1c) TaxID=298654 RepID=UPI0001BFB853|nr:hypothetical protein [Pseudofrankia inefficax]
MVPDLSVQAVHVTKQAILCATDADARSRLTGTYMIFWVGRRCRGLDRVNRTYACAGAGAAR